MFVHGQDLINNNNDDNDNKNDAVATIEEAQAEETLVRVKLSPRPRGMAADGGGGNNTGITSGGNAAGGADTEQEIRRALDVVQSMIDLSADRLEGLRTQCSTSAELTQQEIRTLEV